MYLSPRDRQIVMFLARFQQATAEHIFVEVFEGLASQTPCNRALARLMRLGIITRTQFRIVGGAKGGSGRYCYMLDNIGARMAGLDKRQRVSRPIFHTLAVVDSYIAFKSCGDLVAYQVEPRLVIGSVDVRPDLYVELRGTPVMRMFVEIDLGTEGSRQLRGKLETYYRAWLEADPMEYQDNYPGTLWVTPDDVRARELQALIDSMPSDAHQIFSITTADGLRSRLVDK